MLWGNNIRSCYFANGKFAHSYRWVRREIRIYLHSALFFCIVQLCIGQYLPHWVEDRKSKNRGRGEKPYSLNPIKYLIFNQRDSKEVKNRGITGLLTKWLTLYFLFFLSLCILNTQWKRSLVIYWYENKKYSRSNIFTFR